MHPELARVFQGLAGLRTAAGLTEDQVELDLVLGPGWVNEIESGATEPTIGMLAALLSKYGTSLGQFFSTVNLGATPQALDRHLSYAQTGKDVSLAFPMGASLAQVTLANATVDELGDVLRTLRNELATGTNSLAVAQCFLAAVAKWPHLNPSDLWYFLVSHAYQDDFNHPARDKGKDWSQSWKRASGWALEDIFVKHYNPAFVARGLSLEMPDPTSKSDYLAQMSVSGQSATEKADIILVRTVGATKTAFGVVHVKASFAERRTDDVPLSKELMNRGYASPLLTMDGKAAVAARPVNRGELGAVQGGADRVSSKRLDIEQDRNFDACFSYNANTLATPAAQAAAARIQVADFRNPNDKFAQYVVEKAVERFGSL